MSRRAPTSSRLAAGAVALVGGFGLAVQLVNSTAFVGSVGGALWGMARYYTNLGNAGVALIFACFALGLGVAQRPVLIGGAVINAALIGIVYRVMLAGIHHPGESPLASMLLHNVAPPLAVLFWLVFAPRGLHWRDPLWWTVPPLAYFAYVLMRSAHDGHYPYPFIDVARIGWARTAVNAVVITLGFLVFGLGLVALDKLVKGGQRR